MGDANCGLDAKRGALKFLTPIMVVLLIGLLLSQSLTQEVHINHNTESPNEKEKCSPTRK